MFLIGVSHYYATGEGVTVYVASGNEETIRKKIPEYYHPGLIILSPPDWVQVANGDNTSEKYLSGVAVLKTYLPVLWEQIEQNSCHFDISLKHYYNCS
ncbi:hypothetical protein [Photobacterium leiognathi]|uniref:hypothetical protein n=1 Tax=Photobacterium leiognathi TaxID=553611 RepID=UPI002981A693|nr:hypothetical protein [Photobacterium leiognathi]